MSVIKVRSSTRDYEAHIGSLSEALEKLILLEHKCFVVDENVQRYYADGILKSLPQSGTIIFPAQEELKTLEGVKRIYEHLLRLSAKRNLTLITIGGGILQDVTGFVASTLYRGINWIFIPTTLLAQADSCIGSKTSLNYQGYKNLLGSFYPPAEVWIDPSFLGTLQDQDFYSGLGEVIKLHIIGGQEKIKKLLSMFDLVCARDKIALQKAIQTSLEIKLDYIINDEFDLGRRNMLNYGHCIGHAIEAVSDFRIPHGQAVVAGMILANRIASKRGILSEQKCRFLEEKLLLPSLKVKFCSSDLNSDPIIKAMAKDKKRTGKGLAMIMITDGGDMIRANDLESSEINSVLAAAEGLL